MLVKNPSKYFKQYRSFFDDDENGAFSFLANEFNSYIYRLNFWNRVVDEKNKKNIKTLAKIISLIVQDIKDGKSGKYRVTFYKNTGSGYQNKEYIFDWNYL